ncbi:MAG: alpha/beta hydrolase [Thermoguttaceae bacterium]
MPLSTFASSTISKNSSISTTNRISDFVEPLGLELDFGRPRYAAETARPHILFAPMHYEAGYAYPLVVWLHSSGHDERQVMRTMPQISMRNYVAVAPQGMRLDAGASPAISSENSVVKPRRRSERAAAPRYDWLTTREGVTWAERAVFESIDLAAQRCNIARHRVFLVGSGSGGTMALQLATRFPQEFAAVVSLGGGLPAGNLPLRSWAAIRRLSVLLVAGEQSQNFTPSDANKLRRLFHSAGVPVTLQQHASGDEFSDDILADVNRYLMSIVV